MCYAFLSRFDIHDNVIDRVSLSGGPLSASTELQQLLPVGRSSHNINFYILLFSKEIIKFCYSLLERGNTNSWTHLCGNLNLFPFFGIFFSGRGKEKNCVSCKNDSWNVPRKPEWTFGVPFIFFIGSSENLIILFRL